MKIFRSFFPNDFRGTLGDVYFLGVHYQREIQLTLLYLVPNGHNVNIS